MTEYIHITFTKIYRYNSLILLLLLIPVVNLHVNVLSQVGCAKIKKQKTKNHGMSVVLSFLCDSLNRSLLDVGEATVMMHMSSMKLIFPIKYKNPK